MSSFAPLIFIGLSLLTVVSAAWIAFSKNLVHSAFALLGTFAGVAGLFIMLGADFLGIVQLLVYIGGILVLYLFAVLMTTGIGDIRITNQSISVKAAVPALILFLLLIAKLVYTTHWFVADQLKPLEPTTGPIGNALLGQYLLPFELISILLLATLVGAVAAARKEINRKE